jgi:N-acetylglucosamine-6-phosphate deacetylase
VDVRRHLGLRCDGGRGAARPLIVAAGTVLAHDRIPSPGFVAVEDGRIARVAEGAPPPCEVAEVFRFPNDTLVPGFIDLEVNGAAGVDCLRARPGDYAALGRYVATTGVTAYLPTIVAAPLEEMRNAAAVAAEAAARAVDGLPEVLGVHL